MTEFRVLTAREAHLYAKMGWPMYLWTADGWQQIDPGLPRAPLRFRILATLAANYVVRGWRVWRWEGVL